MKSFVKGTVLASSLVLFSGVSSAADFSGVPSGLYQVDPTHAYINFSYSHLGLSNPVLGFDDFTMDLNLNHEEPAKSTVEVVIETSSIISGSEIWTDHLMGEQFFNAAQYPQITFTSTSVEAERDGNYRVNGDLKIKDSVQPVTLEVTINAAMNHPMSGKPTIGLDADAEILRSAWGLGKFAPNISDEVSLSVTAELVMSK